MTNLTTHPFYNTLGPGPYKYIGYGTFITDRGIDSKYVGPECEHKDGVCSHCGTHIHHVYVIQTAEGRKFGVGSDCIFKLNQDDEFEGMADVEKHVKEMKRKQAKVRREKQLLFFRTECTNQLETHKDHLNRVLYYYRKDKSAYEMFIRHITYNHSLNGWKDMHKKIQDHVSKSAMSKVELEIYREMNKDRE